jgi:hypothetical protein
MNDTEKHRERDQLKSIYKPFYSRKTEDKPKVGEVTAREFNVVYVCFREEKE